MIQLTLSMLWANSADDKLIFFFLIFPRKQDLTVHANCLLRRQFTWNVKSYFLGNIRKNISKYLLLNFLPSMLSLEKKWIEKMNRAETWENVPFVVCPAVWSESLLSVWRSFGFLTIHSSPIQYGDMSNAILSLRAYSRWHYSQDWNKVTKLETLSTEASSLRTICLMFSMLGKTFSIWRFKVFFFWIFQKIGLDISCKLSLLSAAK